MKTSTFSTTATGYLTAFGSSAHKAINAYRQGGEQLADTLEQQWKAALKRNAAQLTPETRKNAARAQQAASALYAKGLALSSDGARVVVDTLVGAGIAGVQRTSAMHRPRSGRTA
jgi:hypothetical protein